MPISSLALGTSCPSEMAPNRMAFDVNTPVRDATIHIPTKWAALKPNTDSISSIISHTAAKKSAGRKPSGMTVHTMENTRMNSDRHTESRMNSVHSPLTSILLASIWFFVTGSVWVRYPSSVYMVL